jgi:hypothetical protein
MPAAGRANHGAAPALIAARPFRTVIGEMPMACPGLQPSSLACGITGWPKRGQIPCVSAKKPWPSASSCAASTSAPPARLGSEVHRTGAPRPVQVSDERFRSMEAACQAGQACLTDLIVKRPRSSREAAQRPSDPVASDRLCQISRPAPHALPAADRYARCALPLQRRTW